MPFWGWVLLVAVLSALAVAAVLAIVRGTKRLPAREPLHGDPDELASPLPLDVAEADSMTERELEDEHARGEAGVDGARPQATRSPHR